MKDFAIVICAYTGVTSSTAACIERCHQELEDKFEVFYYTEDAFIDRVRNIATTHFLKSDHSPYMIFIDHDILFTPGDIHRLYQDLCNGYHLIGGLYSVRDGGHVALSTIRQEIRLDGTIKEVRYLATGFMGFDKEILTQMVDKLKLPLLHEKSWCECYPFFTFCYSRSRKILLSEDWTFCVNARKAGYKVFVDTSIQVGHKGQKIYFPRDCSKEYQCK